MCCLLSRASLALTFLLSLLVAGASGDSPALAEIKVLKKGYERRAKDEMDAVARWYAGQLQELKRTAGKGDASAAAEVDRELAEEWYKQILGRPPAPGNVSQWLPLQKLRIEAQGRRAKAVDPVTRRYREELDTIARRSERTNDGEGLREVRKAWREAFPLAPTEAETMAWLVGTRWSWWGAETLEIEANGRARYVWGQKIQEMRWKLQDPLNVRLTFGTVEPGPKADRLEMFWTHCINHSQGGKTWTINRLDK